MARIKYFDGTKYIEIEVSEEFAAEYAELEHKEKLTERKETRRHQSLDKSMEHAGRQKISAPHRSISLSRRGRMFRISAITN